MLSVLVGRSAVSSVREWYDRSKTSPTIDLDVLRGSLEGISVGAALGALAHALGTQGLDAQIPGTVPKGSTAAGLTLAPIPLDASFGFLTAGIAYFLGSNGLDESAIDFRNMSTASFAVYGYRQVNAYVTTANAINNLASSTASTASNTTTPATTTAATTASTPATTTASTPAATTNTG